MSETLPFKISLYAEPCNGFPKARVSVDGKVYFDDYVVNQPTSKKPKIIKFDHDCDEGSHQLKIELYGKNDKQNNIIEDNKLLYTQLLIIDSVDIDCVDIGGMLYQGVYQPDYSESYKKHYINEHGKHPEKSINVYHLGWNGAWTLDFDSPFYMWMLENYSY